MSGLKALLGDSVIDGKYQAVPVESLNNKIVGLYFSAHWCPPCRRFTPELVKAYNKLKDSGKQFEIIFISSDRDEESFKEYFGEMPWLALPFADRDGKEKLSRKFGVSGIPTLIILDSNGNILNKDGRSALSEDPEGKDFPWCQKTLPEILNACNIVNQNGETKSFQQIQNDNVALGIYFSAHWCPPCRGFTPELVKTYQKLKDSGKKFEIIFVSSDRDEESFKEYFGEMPWLALPFADREAKKQLSSIFEVEGIPTLVILDAKTLKPISLDGRSAVSSDPDGNNFPWYRKALAELDSSVGLINDVPTLILMVEDIDQATYEPALKALEHVATQYNTDFVQRGLDGKELPIMFTYATKDSNIAPRVRGLTNISKDCHLLLLNIPSGKKHAVTDPISKMDSVFFKTTVDSFLNGTLPQIPLKE